MMQEKDNEALTRITMEKDERRTQPPSEEETETQSAGEGQPEGQPCETEEEIGMEVDLQLESMKRFMTGSWTHLTNIFTDVNALDI